MAATQNVDIGARLRRRLLYIAGWLSLALGVIGAFLPILPTTPFLLLASACFMRSSPKAAEWMLNNRYFGEYVRDFQENRGIPMGVKIRAIVIMWASLAVSAYVMPVPWARWLLLIPGTGVTIFLLRYKTRPATPPKA